MIKGGWMLANEPDAGSTPDFYLSTAGEDRRLASPRECREVVRLTGPTARDYMLIRVSPEVIGQALGSPRDLSTLLISPRLEGGTLFPIKEWPCPVYVSRLLDEDVLATLRLERNQVELISWGTLFRTREHAVEFAKQFG
jgi:hypothetical protein